MFYITKGWKCVKYSWKNKTTVILFLENIIPNWKIIQKHKMIRTLAIKWKVINTCQKHIKIHHITYYIRSVSDQNDSSTDNKINLLIYML